MAQLGHGWKVEKSAERITSFAGLPLLTELAHRSQLIKDLDALPGSWERHGRYATSDYVLSLALTLIAGGEGLEDARLAPNSLGDFPRRFGHMTISRLKRVNARQVRRALAQRGPGHLTSDVDSSI